MGPSCGSGWLDELAGTTFAALSLASKVMTQAATIRNPAKTEIKT